MRALVPFLLRVDKADGFENGRYCVLKVEQVLALQKTDFSEMNHMALDRSPDLLHQGEAGWIVLFQLRAHKGIEIVDAKVSL